MRVRVRVGGGYGASGMEIAAAFHERRRHGPQYVAIHWITGRSTPANARDKQGEGEEERKDVIAYPVTAVRATVDFLLELQSGKH